MAEHNSDESSDRLGPALSALVPNSLDEVIKYNRENFQLRLATDEEIFDLYKTITPAQPKDVMADWNLITLFSPDGSAMWLLGEVRRKGCPRISSDVTGVDLINGFLTTRSGSLYQLGNRKNGPPTKEEIFLVCSAFHDWGFGAALGVPNFSDNKIEANDDRTN